MNVQEIAQKLVDELKAELNKKAEEQVLIQGAIQGVNLLYTRLLEADKPVVKEVADEQNSKPKRTAAKAASKK